MLHDRVIYDCPNVACVEPLYAGRCKQACLDRYNKCLGNSKAARWQNRVHSNDYLWAECSNCGFRVEAYKAVKTGKSSTSYTEVIYKFCPICGKPMEV